MISIQYVNSYGHVTFGIVVEPKAVSQEKKLMIYSSLHGPGQIYAWRIILLLMNPWLIKLPVELSCSDNVSDICIELDTQGCCPHYENSLQLAIYPRSQASVWKQDYLLYELISLHVTTKNFHYII